jgi:hypothetical protein
MGGCWKVLEPGAAFQHVLTASSSTVTYDQAGHSCEHCPIRLRVWTDSQAIGVALEAVNAYAVSLKY